MNDGVWGLFMKNIEFNYDDIEIKSIELEDVIKVGEWLNDNSCNIPTTDMYSRFLEYYASENEVFLQAIVHDKIVAVFKGRIQGQENKELFIWFYVIGLNHRGKGVGKWLIELIYKYFEKNYFVTELYSGVDEKNIMAYDFWSHIGFQEQRRVHEFFQECPKGNSDLIIFKKYNM